MATVRLTFTVRPTPGQQFHRPAFSPRDLGDREAGPQPWFDDYATHAEYREAWYLWRAIRRDARLTDAERRERYYALVDRLGAPRDRLPW